MGTESQWKRCGKGAPWTLGAWAFALACVAGGTSTRAALVARLEVTVGTQSQSYSSGGATPAAIGVPGATAASQFTYSSGSSGLGSLVDGPAVSATLNAGSGLGDVADASVQYGLTVVGPAGDATMVPLLISGQYRTINPDELPAGAGGIEAHSLIGVLGASGYLFQFRSDSYNYPPEFQEVGPEVNPGAGTYHGSFSVAAGSSLTVGLRALVWHRFDDLAPGSASAEIDPFFQIDPTWAATHPGYSLKFDPGVGNGAPVSVPEPASAVLAIAGLVSLAVVRLRRRSGG